MKSRLKSFQKEMLARYTRKNSKLKIQNAKRKKARFAVITTAVPLTKEEEKRVRDWIKRNLGNAIKIRTVVDPKVIAGMRVRAGDWLFDGTFAAELERVKGYLIEG